MWGTLVLVVVFQRSLEVCASPINFLHAPSLHAASFGVIDMVVEKSPVEQSVAEAEEAVVRAAVLERLDLIKKRTAENRCVISFDFILDQSGHVDKEGIVAVVEKLPDNFRIELFRMEEFRRWVTRRPVDLGSNVRFDKEAHVWVLRLMTESSNKKPLPNLIGNKIDYSFLTSFALPTSDSEHLITDWVNHDHVLSFRLTRIESRLSNRDDWHWSLLESNIHEVGQVVMQAKGSWFFNSEWMVQDALDRELFRVKAPDSEGTYRICPPSSEEPRFVLQQLQYGGMRIRKTDIEATLYYAGEGRAYSNGYRLVLVHYFSGRLAAHVWWDPRVRSFLMRIDPKADVALLLVSAALIRF